ncbi:ATP-dependent DNA helicase [Microbacterium betulae]|uniref:DNA 3'-5' helicase n=1 Tax=Microbacterium betulae TaxID=2981139 RepID=A0AA97FJK4_9MICO|nr:ATP-dependent DNA helicase [Microbacterium sp. AB]WOF24458.1 ATP-dependent DNA helicase [Microbacterium sp. AB]
MTVLGTPARRAWTGARALSADVIAAALGQPRPTDAQREVIEASPAPALVVAGAGSGKTETMAARVVWLVANGHVAAEEILGLTFTRKAAGELADRIGARLARIGELGDRGLLPHLPRIVAEGRLERVERAEERSPAARETVRRQVLDELASEFRTGWDPRRRAGVSDLLDRPRVATYNAFADAVVREHAARIGRDPEAALLSQSASWLLARQVVMNAADIGLDELDNALSTIVEAVQRLAGDALDHRADLDAVEAFAAQFAGELGRFADPSRATKREIDKAWDNLTALPRLLALVRAYGEEKRRRGVLDFADQVTGALEIVESSPQVADELRSQYRVVLLDEYQDTSVVQTRLLATVFRDMSVMAVGDPNQSIYGWRGAGADNLHAFSGAFSREVAAGRHDLMISWRNDRAILVAANRLLSPLGGEGTLPLEPLRERPGAGPGTVERRYERTVEEEADAVAEWFARVREAHGRGAAPGARAHTGAILFRAKRHMQTFAGALDAHGVPHRILGLGGLLSTPEVTDVVAALRVVHDPTQGSALIRLLVGPRFGIGIADMGALHDLATTLSRRDGALAPLSDEVLARIRASAGADEQVSIVDAVDFVRTVPDDYRLLSAISPEGRARLREAGALLDRLRRAAGQPIPDLIRLVEAELRLDIELAANETRGPARVASTQLRAFVDEVRAFLDADDRGTIGSLLAWLDHAEQTDELMPRTEPPEPGVVQLLTIHGSKGLEWDSVAVVRLTAGELPKTPTGTAGWLGFGVLPYPFRGDRAALPRVDWTPGPETDAKDLENALRAFKEGGRQHQLAEERRLAYVAVTRARSELLLTGSHWAGQSRPRGPSAFLEEIAEELGLDPIAPLDDDANPYDGEGGTLQWPLDALGSRRARVEDAAAVVRSAVGSTPQPTAELARLLAERRQRDEGSAPVVPTRVQASRFKDYVTDFAGTTGQLARPLPERPYRQTRIGTLFHQWVEQRSGLVGAGPQLDDALWDGDDEAGAERASGTASTDVSAADAAEMERLQEIFERSEWAALQPLDVETEIDFVLPGADGEAPHIVICKLDAVYRRADRGGRIEIVDWKTGRAPRTPAEREDRMLQLALYRLAYHERHGVPLEEIDVALFYVADDLVLRGERVYTADELSRRWNAARRDAARRDA